MRYNWLQRISEEQFGKKYMLNKGDKDIYAVMRGVAKTLSSKEKATDIYKYKFYELLIAGKFIPAGRILANARPNTKHPFYNNCFTIGIEDSIDSIYDGVKESALIAKAGGGCGINYSNLRPKDDSITSGGKSSGSVSFMKVFNANGRVILSGGGRRMALIGLLEASHPDIFDFIHAGTKPARFALAYNLLGLEVLL